MVSLLLWGMVAWCVVREVGKPFPGFRCEITLSVSPQNLATWNGPKGGLRPYDRFTSANGKRLVTYADLDRLVRESPVGTPITYELLRKGEKRTVTVPTQMLGWADVAKGFGATLLIALLQLLIGAAAFWLKPTHPATQAHLILAASTGIGFQTLGVDFTWGHQFTVLYSVAVNFIAAAAIHLALAFPNPVRILRNGPWILVLVYAPAVALATISVLSYQPVGIVAHVPPQGIFAHYLPLWSAWTIIGFLVLIARAGFVAFLAKRRLARAQGRMLIVGGTLAYLPSIIAYVIPVGLRQTAELSMSTIMAVYMCFVIFPLAVTYAILRHQLFAINLVLKRTATYSSLVVALVVLYVTSSSLAQWLLGPHHDNLHVVTTAVLVVAVIPLHRWCRMVMDRYFFRQPYSFTDVVTRFGEASSDLREPDRLIELYLDAIDAALSPTFSALLLRDGEQLGIRACRGIEPQDLEQMVEQLEDTGTTAGFVERTLGDRPPILVGVLAVRENERGLVILGERKSDLDFSPEDKLLLMNLSHQLGLTLKNASLFAEALERNQQLEAMNRSLLELDQLKRDFLNATSHELRTPLASIIGYSEFLEDRVGGELTDEQAFFVTQIQDGGRRLKRLVEDLLDVTRFEAGTLQFAPREVDLAGSIRQVLAALQPQLGAAGLSVEEELPEGPLAWIVDPDRLEQVLFNLLGNAIKFTPPGGTLGVSLRVDAAGVRIAVRDTGIGIAPEHLPHLFEKFYQVDPSSTRRFGGLGLGLSITKAIVEAHRGVLEVASTPGEGTCFTFTLPAPPASEAGAAARALPAAAARA